MTIATRPVRVTTANEAAARDADAIAAGMDSFALMAAAGTVAAAEVLRDAGDAVAHGVAVWCGGGNNGGDGYIVAAQLVRLGVRVHVVVVAPPRTPDAQRAAALAERAGVPVRAAPMDAAPMDAAPMDGAPMDGAPMDGAPMDGAPMDGAPMDEAPDVADPPGVLVDALLGTGAHGALRDDIARATARIARARAAGARIVALDLPTGVDATTGACADGHVRAHCTITFGTVKLGLLAAREACGRIVVADIGLGEHAARRDAAALLADAQVLHRVVPPVAWDAHKGTRGRVLVIGGTAGMAGAVQFVARGALASGAGLVRAMVHPESVAALQAAVPAVVCVRDADADALAPAVAPALAWAHAVVLGPGLGRDEAARSSLRAALEALHAMRTLQPAQRARHRATQVAAFLAPTPPVLVLDADALVLAAEPALFALLRACAEHVPVVLTPHAGEFSRLAEACDAPWREQATDLTGRLQAVRHVAAVTGAHVLLKGAPTCCVAPDGTAWLVPRGSAALATGGTGDVLAGVLGAVAAHTRAGGTVVANEPTALAAAAAWVHGVAGELAASGGDGRGVTVDDVIGSLGDAWSRLRAAQAIGAVATASSRAAATRRRLPPGVLAELPAVPQARE